MNIRIVLNRNLEVKGSTSQLSFSLSLFQKYHKAFYFFDFYTFISIINSCYTKSEENYTAIAFCAVLVTLCFCNYKLFILFSVATFTSVSSVLFTLSCCLLFAKSSLRFCILFAYAALTCFSSGVLICGAWSIVL